MPTITDCPACGRKLRVPDGLRGAQVQCPTCGRRFTAALEENVPRPGVPVHPVEETVASDQEESAGSPVDGPLQLSLDEADSSRPKRMVEVPPPPPPLRAVPVPCSDDCGRDLDDRPWSPEDAVLRRDWEPHRGNFIVVLGVLSLATLVLCPLVGLPTGIAAWSMGQTDLRLMRTNRMDPEGNGLTQAGMWCGVIGTILHGLILLGCGLIVVGGM